jgi:hypothetical protein
MNSKPFSSCVAKPLHDNFVVKQPTDRNPVRTPSLLGRDASETDENPVPERAGDAGVNVEIRSGQFRGDHY